VNDHTHHSVTAPEPAATRAVGAGPGIIRVWDPFVRVFHWTLATTLILNYFVIDDGRTLHNALGYLSLGLIALRVVWGFVSPSRYARFANFVSRPRTFFAHTHDFLRRRDERHLGHNPAGGAMIIALLTLMTLVGVTGWMQTDWFWGVEWVQDAHAILSTITVAFVAMHVAGVLYQSWNHGENLILAMIWGYKRGPDSLNVGAAEKRHPPAQADQ
jgi:cytochrome b